MKKLIISLILFCSLAICSSANATVFYIDLTDGLDTNDGLSTSTAWKTFEKFTEQTRSVGDTGFVRRGGIESRNADLNFTSDGILNNPITITADFDNIWGDFATSTQTYTPVVGSKVIASSASTTDIVAGDWIYVYGDCFENPDTTQANECKYYYEVESVTTNEINLYMPYKGNNAGSGKDLRIMPYSPTYNILTASYQWAMIQDSYWILQGFKIGSIDPLGAIRLNRSKGTVIRNMIIEHSVVANPSLSFNEADNSTYVYNLRVSGATFVFYESTSLNLDTFYFDCGTYLSVSRYAFRNVIDTFGLITAKNGEIINCNYDIGVTTNYAGEGYYFQNVKRVNAYQNLYRSAYTSVYLEDDFGIVGLNSRSSSIIESDTKATTTVSDYSVLRDGGGSSSQKVIPPVGTTANGVSTRYFPFSYIKLFEYPIYADTSNKQYDMYFYATSTGVFTANPTADELYIECEYYGASSGADRRIEKSTGVIDFIGTAGWQSLSVQCEPAQSGVMYLRGYYAKPVESGKDNVFYMDIKPVISTP